MCLKTIKMVTSKNMKPRPLVVAEYDFVLLVGRKNTNMQIKTNWDILNIIFIIFYKGAY